MRVETTSQTLYHFSELSPDAQAKAVEQEQEFQGETFDHEYVYEDAVRMGRLLGIEIGTRTARTYGGKNVDVPDIQYSGFWSQGDGASFSGTYEYAKGAEKAVRDETGGTEEELMRIARELQALQSKWFYGLTAEMVVSGHYVHSGCMQAEVHHKRDAIESGEKALPWKELQQLMRDFADWIYKRLNGEYDDRTSEEYCRDWLSQQDGEVEYTETGKRV